MKTCPISRTFNKVDYHNIHIKMPSHDLLSTEHYDYQVTLTRK